MGKKIQKIPAQSDSFDVKKNLSKLKAFGDKTSNSFTEDFSNETNNNESSFTSSSTQGSFEQTTYQEIKLLNNKINSDISVLKDQFYQTKDSLFKKIGSEISNVEKKFETKLDGKVDNKYFIGAISVLLLIAGLIGTLSYFPMKDDIKDLNNSNAVLKDSIVKINSRIDKIKYSKK